MTNPVLNVNDPAAAEDVEAMLAALVGDSAAPQQVDETQFRTPAALPATDDAAAIEAMIDQATGGASAETVTSTDTARASAQAAIDDVRQATITAIEAVAALDPAHVAALTEIGRASCRERVL